MLKILCLFTLLLYRISSQENLIIVVNHALKNGLNYIQNNYENCNTDCLLGIEIASVFLEDGFNTESAVLDTSTFNLYHKTTKIISKLRNVYLNESEQNSLILKYIANEKIWKKPIKFDKTINELTLLPNEKTLFMLYHNPRKLLKSPSTDFCLLDIVNETLDGDKKICNFDKNCLENYMDVQNLKAGYELTHQLLMLQLIRARKCILNPIELLHTTTAICSKIYHEMKTIFYYERLDDLIDLFLEQQVLCGFEGYKDFLTKEFLMVLLKAQKGSGCFPAYLNFDRMKRNINIFADGCADHTTGLGIATLAMYYNFLVKIE